MVDPLVIPGVDRIVVRGSYDCAPIAQYIQKLKYHFWSGAAATLKNIMGPMSEELASMQSAVIVPVPLHHRRQRERGFNQAVIIARALSAMTGFPVIDLLNRNRYTPPQARLDALQRTINVHQAFGAQTVARRPKSVIIVDDVITTGSTISECATVLRKQGTTTIWAIALAKG